MPHLRPAHRPRNVRRSRSAPFAATLTAGLAVALLLGAAPAGSAPVGSSSTIQATTTQQATQPSARPAARKVARKAAGDRYATKAFRATNAERRTQGLRPLKSNKCLVRAARSQAQAMAVSGTIYHQPLSPVLSRCKLRMVGENVAMGYPTGRAVVRGWMGSPGHRENILRREYRLVGIAAAKGGDGRWYSAQVFGRR